MGKPRRQHARPRVETTRDPGRKPVRTLHGGIPWPSLGDGTPYCDQKGLRVRHTEAPDNVGALGYVEWCTPEGAYMTGERHTAKGPKPGAWFAVVSWDGRDPLPAIKARVELTHLELETPEP